jgi:predicted AlkP superfamily phosphohydrolase/phosphomutase
MTHRTLAALIACALALAARGAAQERGRLVVLGFDGADARTAERLMDAGELPNLAALRASGTFAPLGTTVPAESPVSWAALNSGQNPAETGIFGFIERANDAALGPLPELGHVAHEERAVERFDLPALERVLVAWDPWLLAACAGAASLLLFLALFSLLLRLRARASVPLALVLGLAGGAGAWVAQGHVPRAIADVVANPTQAAPFWEHAARAGVACVVIDGAMAWDREPVEGARVLAGLGVPDVRSNNGDWFVYTTDPRVLERAPAAQPTASGGRIVRVDLREGRIESRVFGPLDFVAIDRAQREVGSIGERLGRPGLSAAAVEELRARQRALQDETLPRLFGRGRWSGSDEGRASLPLTVVVEDGAARVAIGGHEQILREGEWSRWYHLTFELSPLMKVRAITRCKLVRLSEPFELFVDFLQHDPAHPAWWQPVSQPPGFAAELARAAGAPYETVGWACLTMPFKDREIDAQTFLEDAESTLAWREVLLRAALGRDDWRALVFVESTVDRVQHMLYRHADPAHPGHDPEEAAQRVRYLGQEIALSEAIRASYRAMDRLVGEVVERHLRPGDTLIVCSDHGFQSFRRQVHLNNWLAREGYLALRPGARPGGAPLGQVDWSRTRAYAVGLGGIYLNLRGREKDGTVLPAEAPALLGEIRARLLALTDGEGGPRAVRSVYALGTLHASPLYRGPHAADQADLVPGFEAGWRVSWATSLGDVALQRTEDDLSYEAAPVFEDNLLNWSGDHVSVAEDLVRGVFLSNRRFTRPAQGVDLLHVAPTALALLGVALPDTMDRPPLELAP